MYLDVIQLRDFYYRTALGRVAQRVMRDQLSAIWPEARGLTVAGFGFAVPLLRPYLAGARRVIGLMPAAQGVMAWPGDLPNVSVLCDHSHWPLETGHLDRLVILHGLEHSEQPRAILDEAYRTLGPGGRVVVVVPHRAGVWARSESTPFGYGRPYSTAQLESQLRRHGFRPEHHHTMLYQPPTSRRFWLRTGPIWERIGQAVSPVVAGGVLMVEASKHQQVAGGRGLRAAVRQPLSVLAPRPGPASARGFE
ncbi:MAG: methyltransferase domain-containing protein [Rhodobacteraceae bacterium]|nr:methyltransferase domain-containing protein [Paracoccaceae bacterium]